MGGGCRRAQALNYRHAFHAGNHADVFKHVVLTRVLAYLMRKEKPIRVIDTHAGIGLYDLGAAEAVRSPEWRDGIARLQGAALPEEAAELVRPYLDAVAAANAGGRLLHYPGSPWIAAHMMRPQDRLVAVELHPADHGLLAETFDRDSRVKALQLDGWMALGAQVPPKERRGLVLVDPPFEETADWTRLPEQLAKAHAKWPTGVYMLWYPITASGPVSALHHALRRSGMANVLAAELTVRGAGAPGLRGSGLVVVNPPFTLEAELAVLLPALRDVLALDESADVRQTWLAGEA